MRIIAYTYDAGMHCVACTRHAFKILPPLRTGMQRVTEWDEHGVPLSARDSVGNYVHPVFTTDERESRRSCETCLGWIDDDEVSA